MVKIFPTHFGFDLLKENLDQNDDDNNDDAATGDRDSVCMCKISFVIMKR